MFPSCICSLCYSGVVNGIIVPAFIRLARGTDKLLVLLLFLPLVTGVGAAAASRVTWKLEAFPDSVGVMSLRGVHHNLGNTDNPF